MELFEARTPFERGEAELAGGLHRFSQESFRLRGFTDVEQRCRQLREELEPCAIPCGQELACTRQQISRRTPVKTVEGSPSCGAELRRCSPRELPAVLVGLAKFSPVSIRALEVVAEDFFVLGRPSGRLWLQPVGVTLVRLGTEQFRRGLVRGVADQDVAEAEAFVALEVGAVTVDQFLVHKRRELRVKAAADILRQQVRERAAVEVSSLNRGMKKDRPLGRCQPVDAGG